jgi:hypothetical protein
MTHEMIDLLLGERVAGPAGHFVFWFRVCQVGAAASADICDSGSSREKGKPVVVYKRQALVCLHRESNGADSKQVPPMSRRPQLLAILVLSLTFNSLVMSVSYYTTDPT